MKLFVLSYPDHSRLTQLSAYYGCKNIQGVSELIFVWDDFHCQPHPFGNATVVNYSEFSNTKEATFGWLRQQFVKLQLHEFTTDESFYILDGDTIVRNNIDLRPNRLITGSEYYVPYFDLIRDMLGLEKQNNFSFISPLLRFDREVLIELDNYSKKRNGYGIAETFLLMNKTNTPSAKVSSFSEGEIYGTFASQVMSMQFEYLDFPFQECTIEKTNNKDFEDLYFNNTCDLVWSGTENYLSENFWKQCYPKDFTLATLSTIKKK